MMWTQFYSTLDDCEAPFSVFIHRPRWHITFDSRRRRNGFCVCARMRRRRLGRRTYCHLLFFFLMNTSLLSLSTKSSSDLQTPFLRLMHYIRPYSPFNVSHCCGRSHIYSVLPLLLMYKCITHLKIFPLFFLLLEMSLNANNIYFSLVKPSNNSME